MNTQTKKILVAGIGLLALARLAVADDTLSGHSGVDNLQQGEAPNVLTLNPGFTYTADADFDNKDLGKLNVWRFDIPARYTIKTGPGDLRLGAFYEYSEYDLDKLAGTQKFNTLDFDVLWKSMINEEWGYFVYGGVGLSASEHAELGNGLTGVGGGGVQYVWSEKLSLGVGLAVSTQMEDDPRVLPIIALNWQINDRWNLRTLNGATISYDVLGDKKLIADFGVNYQWREYRVEVDGHEGSVIDRMLAMEVGATYRFCPAFALRGFVGVAAGRNIEVRANDEKITDQDVDAAPFVGVRALLTF
jgi:hypothetical protein